MERNSKVMAIVALCVGVVGLSLGFAAFSNTLTIKSSASVAPDSSTFNVDFSATIPSAGGDAVTTGSSVVITNEDTLNVGTPTIDNSGDPTISGLSAEFTEPGQTVVYTFYTYNAGELVAYLDSITVANATGGNSPKVCTAQGTTTQALVDTACNGISLNVSVDGVSTSQSVPGISGHSLAVDGTHTVVVTLEYAEGAGRADGDFNVAFGDITLTYESVDNTQA